MNKAVFLFIRVVNSTKGVGTVKVRMKLW